MPPLFSDGALHLVQGQVEVLDHVPVSLPVPQAPGIQEVIGRFPHGLRDKADEELSTREY